MAFIKCEKYSLYRAGLCRDLGFFVADRHENIRQIGEAAKLLADEGMIFIAATFYCGNYFTRPTNAHGYSKLFSTAEFVEIFTPLAVCEQRDPKSLYRKARPREVKEFTGIHSAYETRQRRTFIYGPRQPRPKPMPINHCVFAATQLFNQNSQLTKTAN